MNVDTTNASLWSPQGHARPSFRFAPISQAALRRRPKAVEDFFRQLVESTVLPILRADPQTRWDALQGVLVGPFVEVLHSVPNGVPNSAQVSLGAEEFSDSSADSSVELLIQTLINEQPDDDSVLTDILSTGRRYLRRRQKILSRRNELRTLVGIPQDVEMYAAQSHTAERGFHLALLTCALHRYIEQDLEHQTDAEFWAFMFGVLERGGTDQYVLLRAAETELIDIEEASSVVPEGPQTEQGSEMEAQAHQAWLDLEQ